MQITNDDLKKIMEYTKSVLQTELNTVQWEIGVKSRAVSEIVINALPSIIKLDELLASINEKKERKKSVQTNDEGFETFWLNYPATANFIYKGVKFRATRVLRSNKEVCRTLYHKALKENNITDGQILSAILLQTKMMKDDSYNNGKNELQYLSACEVWLRQEKFLAFIDMKEEGESEYNNCD